MKLREKVKRELIKVLTLVMVLNAVLPSGLVQASELGGPCSNVWGSVEELTPEGREVYDALPEGYILAFRMQTYAKSGSLAEDIAIGDVWVKDSSNITGAQQIDGSDVSILTTGNLLTSEVVEEVKFWIEYNGFSGYRYIKVWKPTLQSINLSGYYETGKTPNVFPVAVSNPTTHYGESFVSESEVTVDIEDLGLETTDLRTSRKFRYTVSLNETGETMSKETLVYEPAIRYYVNGKLNYESPISVFEGRTLTLTGSSEKNEFGKGVIAWSTEPDGQGTIYAVNESFTSTNTTTNLYGIFQEVEDDTPIVVPPFEKPKVTVSYVSPDGIKEEEFEVGDTVTVEDFSGALVETLAFTGWKREAQMVQPGSTFEIKSNVILTSIIENVAVYKWQEVNSMGDLSVEKKIYRVMESEAGRKVIPLQFAGVGGTALYWEDSEGNRYKQGEVLENKSGMVLSMVVKQDPITLSFWEVDGIYTSIPDIEVYKGDLVVLPSLSSLIREGYEPLGYVKGTSAVLLDKVESKQVDADDSNIVEYTYIGRFGTTESIRVYTPNYLVKEYPNTTVDFSVAWVKATPKYTITYHSNDGTNRTETQVVDEDGSIYNTSFITKPSDIFGSREGYILKGWARNEDAIKEEYLANSTQSVYGLQSTGFNLYGVWEDTTPKTKYTINYHYGDAASYYGAYAKAEEIYTEGTEINVLEEPEFVSYTDNGNTYGFAGWVYWDEHTSSLVKVGETHIVMSDLLMIAQWELVTPTLKQHRIFYSMGAVGPDIPSVEDNTVYFDGDTVNLIYPTITVINYPGYKFIFKGYDYPDTFTVTNTDSEYIWVTAIWEMQTTEPSPVVETKQVVETYVDGVLVDKEVVVVPANTIFTVKQRDTAQYTLDSAKTTPHTVLKGNLEFLIGDKDGVIEIFYLSNTVKPEVTYEIHYFFNGIEDEILKEEGKVEEGSVVVATDYSGTDYELDTEKTADLSFVVTSKDTAFNVYYKSKVEQTKVNYEIHYFFDNSEDTSKLETGSVVKGTKITAKDFSDATLILDTEKTPSLTFLVVNEVNIFEVYFKVVPIEVEKFNYTIKHYFDSVEDITKTVTGQGLSGELVTALDYSNAEYELVSALNFIISASSENDFRVDYKTKTNPSPEPSPEPTEPPVVETPTPEPVPPVVTPVPTPVEKTESSVVFLYYYDGELDLSACEFMDSVELGTLVGGFIGKAKDLYVLKETKGLPLLVGHTGNVVEIYYETEDIEYTVNYYKDGVLQPNLTEQFTVKAGTEITEVTDKCEVYYTLESSNLPQVITRDNKVIRVDYSKKYDDYRVVTYVDGVETEVEVIEKQKMGKVVDFVDYYIPEDQDLVEVKGLPLTVGEGKEIGLYYETIKEEPTIEPTPEPTPEPTVEPTPKPLEEEDKKDEGLENAIVTEEPAQEPTPEPAPVVEEVEVEPEPTPEPTPVLEEVEVEPEPTPEPTPVKPTPAQKKNKELLPIATIFILLGLVIVKRKKKMYAVVKTGEIVLNGSVKVKTIDKGIVQLDITKETEKSEIPLTIEIPVRVLKKFEGYKLNIVVDTRTVKTVTLTTVDEKMIINM